MANHVLAALHLVALACGVAVLFKRAAALAAAQGPSDLGKVFFWDNLAGLLALLWIGSGLWRVLGGYDKGTDYYVGNGFFWLKMALVLAVFAVECVPMITFIRWRIALGKGVPVSLSRREQLVRLHWLEFGLILLVIVSASAMARGLGANALGGTRERPESAGARVYARYCVACHQRDGRGLNGTLAADFVTSARLAQPDTQLLRSIAEGVPGSAMPAFGSLLTEAQRRAVLQHVRETYGAAPTRRP